MHLPTAALALLASLFTTTATAAAVALPPSATSIAAPMALSSSSPSAPSSEEPEAVPVSIRDLPKWNNDTITITPSVPVESV